MTTEITNRWVGGKIQFIHDFCKARNAADGSKFDANANVSVKDIAVLESELYKEEQITLNRTRVVMKLKEMFGEDVAYSYLQDLENHLIYTHDETSLKPYCASISLYPFLLEGTKNLGGVSKAPKNLHSFCGSFINLVYQVASNFAGAIATTEFLMYFDYFAKKTYGAAYLNTNIEEIHQAFQNVVYSLNQPASARGNQSVFWNISIFDKYYFEGIFGDFYFPNGTQPDYGSISRLQQCFMIWLHKERMKELLTFPVTTAAMLLDEKTKTPKDADFMLLCAEQITAGGNFFIYQSTKADALSSCCRLRNELADNEFSYTLGAGGVSTGSFQVITLNMSRIAQVDNLDSTGIINRVYEYLAAFRAIVKEDIANGLLPAYTAGYISLDKQFGTIGLNGLLESYETFENPGCTYEEYLQHILKMIKDANTKARSKYGFRYNTELVPAENLGVKNAKWDKEDGFKVPRDVYNSYFFPVEDTGLTVLDKLKLHGEEISQYLDGGAACHINLEQLPSYTAARKLIEAAAKLGVPYWTVNVKSTICKDCGYILPDNRTHCIKCKSDNVEYATRIIGYLKRISSFSTPRQAEESRRGYTNVIL